jgi:uncharacterized coiled-coil protein SlyX
MSEIEQFEARIFAALDRISRAVSENAGQETGLARTSERDAELIEELEATLAEERASLDDARTEAAELERRLEAVALKADAAQRDRDDLARQLEQARAAVAAAERRAADAEAASEAAHREASSAEDRIRAAEENASTARAERDAARRDLAEAKSAADAAARDAEAAAREAVKANATQHLEDRIERLLGRIESQDVQFQRLKDANAHLRDSNAKLREKNVELLADPDAINQSLQAELDSLKVTRAADADEMDNILEELKPLVEEQLNA